MPALYLLDILYISAGSQNGVGIQQTTVEYPAKIETLPTWQMDSSDSSFCMDRTVRFHRTTDRRLVTFRA